MKRVHCVVYVAIGLVVILSLPAAAAEQPKPIAY